MADSEQQTPIEETLVDDVEMGDSAAGAGEETGLTQLEPEAPKLVLFAEYVTAFEDLTLRSRHTSLWWGGSLSASAMHKTSAHGVPWCSHC
jgi:hypothetical protein